MKVKTKVRLYYRGVHAEGSVIEIEDFDYPAMAPFLEVVEDKRTGNIEEEPERPKKRLRHAKNMKLRPDDGYLG